jgi:hypothetical protein
MNEWALLAVVITILLVLIGVAVILVMVRRREGDQVEPNYRALFVMGLLLVAAGVALMISVELMVGLMLVPMGVLWIVVGAVNRDKWKTT